MSVTVLCYDTRAYDARAHYLKVPKKRFENLTSVEGILKNDSKT